MIASISERVLEIYDRDSDYVANIAAKFHFRDLEVAMFATSYMVGASITIIGTECADLDTAKYIQSEFQDTMREFADESSEFSYSWVNPELN